MSTLPPGSKLGRFEISTVLGQGAMGVVYLAMVHDLLLSAPGYKPRLVRILVSDNAGRDRAKVEERLKAE